MSSELEDLKAKAEELAGLAAGRPEAPKARRLAERLEAGQFLVAVVGEFKRGKSTLANALVGESVLPTGVLPLTAIATELRFGEPLATIVYLDGHTEEIPRQRIAAYVTESGNPENVLGVARVEVRGRWPLLKPGAVLVDTPGLASLHDHNTEAGRAALLDADGAIVVLSADSPLSEQERDLLHLLRDRRSPTFFVLNKSDHLGQDELAEVRQFVVKTIEEILHTSITVFAVDARSALLPCTDHTGGGIEFGDFEAALSEFIADDLAAARVLSARRELARLGVSVTEGVEIERAARTVAAETLAVLVERFNAEATVQRRGFEDDRTLLARDIAFLRDEVSAQIGEFARGAPLGWASELEDASRRAPRAHLEMELRRLVESAVESSFGRYRDDALAWVEDRWRLLATGFRAKVQGRVDAARQAAADLFDVPLPRLEIPELAQQRDRFSFLFLHVGSTTEPLSRAVARLVPARWARRRALANARSQLVAEFDKHAGRARWDLAQRLDAARLELERAMRDELEGSITAIVEAADRARRWQARAQEDRDRDEALAGRLQVLGSSLATLAGVTT